MFAIGICYLNGWAMAAADGARKEQAEWPPHPDRVFMALAAAWFETDEDPAEGEALHWLESLPPPAVFAKDCTTRSAVVSYVPVNDTTAGLAVLPEYRTRKARGFPVAIPYDPTVYLVWPKIELDEHRVGLERLAAKVTHVGHSASFVQAWVVEDSDIHPTWEPTEGIATHRMRVFSTGRLENLTHAYNKAKIVEYTALKERSDALRGAQGKEMKEEEKRLDSVISDRFGASAPVSLRPVATRWQGYGRPVKDDSPNTTGSILNPDMIVLSIRGRRVPLTTTLKLTQALRGVLMERCPQQPPPEWFSGHRSNGSPSTKPHMALLPLPFVGDQHADGRVMGLALALPRSLDMDEARHSLGAFLYSTEIELPREHRLFNGRWFDCRIRLETREQTPKNLNPDTWTRASRVWASVTPVVLNRHFKGKDRWEQAAESLKDACGHIGLPRPREVMLHPVSLVEGAPPAREYPQVRRKSDGGRQSHAHAVMIFDEPVRGPVIVGAGRFRGYGLCRPMDS